MSGKPNKYAGTKTEKNLEAAFAGESLSSVFPAAGNSRALNEGVSVTTIKPQQTSSEKKEDNTLPSMLPGFPLRLSGPDY